jgi:hypothetical protein
MDGINIDDLVSDFARQDMMDAECLTSIGKNIIETVRYNQDWIIEIGVYHGETTCFMGSVLKRLPTIYHWIISIDAFERTTDRDWNDYGSYAMYQANLRKYRCEEKAFVISSLSCYAAGFLKPGASFILVDGSHQYADVCQDIEMYKWLLKPGGRMWFHDHHEQQYPGVVNAVNELVRPENGLRIIEQGEVFCVAERVDDISGHCSGVERI